MPMVVGLTGGIGSGKSTVARLFAELGATTINADQLAREVVQPGSPALAAIRQHFGADIVTDQGELDRRRLREHIFANPTERSWLEDLLHPLIAALRQERIAKASGPYVVVEIPLLLEKQLRSEVDRVLVVDVPEDLQVSRTVARDGVDPDGVGAVMAAQIDRTKRLAQADDILDNSGDQALLRAGVEQLHQTYLALAQRGESSRRT